MSKIKSFYSQYGNIDLEGNSSESVKETEFLENIVKNDNIKEILEIGFNAGHSSDTFLRSNHKANVTSFDIGVHDYVKLGKKYIDETYPGRHTLILGDSTVTIPEFIKNNKDNKKFDLIFIDGGHEGDVPFLDMTNCKNLAHKDTILILDDVKTKDLSYWNIKPTEVWKIFVNEGLVSEQGIFDFTDKHGLAYGKYNLI